MYTSLDPRMDDAGELDPSIFPTAIAALALADVNGAEDITHRALDHLAREMEPNGLWRHWPAGHPSRDDLPPDLDDTALASAALEGAGRVLPDNRAVILANRDRRGRFYTWITPRLRRTPPSQRPIVRAQLARPARTLLFFNQTSAAVNDVDAVVNANVVHYLGPVEGTEGAVAYLCDVLRSGTEASCDKWYPNPFMAWYAFARALAGVDRVACFLIERQLAAATPRTVLDVALGASALVASGRVPDDDAVDALLREQRTDGSWRRVSLYFGGRVRLRDGTFATPHPDTPHWGSEELTTALCLEALCGWRAG